MTVALVHAHRWKSEPGRRNSLRVHELRDEPCKLRSIMTGCFGRKTVAFDDSPTRLASAGGGRRRGDGVKDSVAADSSAGLLRLLALEDLMTAWTCRSTRPAPNESAPYGSTSACAIRNCGAAGG
jgi:hypothetical protein